MRFRLLKAVLFLMFLVGSSRVLSADFRYYAWTYQFITMLPGETELEFYTTLALPQSSKPETAIWKRQIEIETGLTPRWDFSFYLVDSYKASDGKTKFDEIKIRTRYKLAGKDTFIVDPLLYVEYKIQTDRTYPDKWETKLILAKDIDRKLNVSLNIIPEEYYKTGTKEKDWKVEYAGGVSYALIGESLRLGAEVKGDLKDDKHAAGPTVSFRGKSLWAAVGSLAGLNNATNDLQFQSIIGIMF